MCSNLNSSDRVALEHRFGLVRNLALLVLIPQRRFLAEVYKYVPRGKSGKVVL